MLGSERMANPVKKVSGKLETVAPGDPHDACSLCGIHRKNAGVMRATCGAFYGKPGCFVVVREEPSH